MQREGNLMKDGKTNTCLCFKENLQEKHKIVQELKGRLQSQQNIFTKATAKNDAAVKTSLVVDEEIAPSSKCFFRGCIFEAVHAKGM